MGSKNAVGEDDYNQWRGGGRLKSMKKANNKFREKKATVSAQYFVLILSSAGYASINFHRYILCFCVAIYFHENSSA